MLLFGAFEYFHEKNMMIAALKKKNGPTLSVSIKSLIKHMAKMMINPSVDAMIIYLSSLSVQI
jgi:hypothetical protein